jgi:hypothetical protein
MTCKVPIAMWAYRWHSIRVSSLAGRLRVGLHGSPESLFLVNQWWAQEGHLPLLCTRQSSQVCAGWAWGAQALWWRLRDPPVALAGTLCWEGGTHCSRREFHFSWT